MEAIPIPDKTLAYIPLKYAEALDAVHRTAATTQRSTNILLLGPQGSGKSTVPRSFAYTYNRPLATIEVGNYAEASEFFGSLELKDGDTQYVDSLFTRAIQTMGCVIHLQELNRGESDRILNGIFSILDPDQRSMYHQESGRTLKVAPGVIIFASMNEGLEFVGTIELDSALKDRFGIVLEMDYPAYDIEALIIEEKTGVAPHIAQSLALIARGVRDNTQETERVSTRSLLEVGHLLKAGISMQEAFEFCVPVSEEGRETIRVTMQAMNLPTKIDIERDAIVAMGEK